MARWPECSGGGRSTVTGTAATITRSVADHDVTPFIAFVAAAVVRRAAVAALSSLCRWLDSTAPGCLRRRRLPRLRRPVLAHLRNAFHVDGRLLAILFGRQRLQEIDRMVEIVLDRLARGVEVDVPQLRERRFGIRRTLLQRFQRDEARRLLRRIRHFSMTIFFRAVIRTTSATLRSVESVRKSRSLRRASRFIATGTGVFGFLVNASATE